MQGRLPFSRDERLAALRQIDPTRLPMKVTRRSWANVVDLVTQIELCTCRDGCFAYAETLAARMAGKTGVSRATFFRVRRLAEDLGILSVTHRINGQGQQSNEWHVSWDRVAVLGSNSSEAASPEPLTAERSKVRPTPEKVRPTSQKVRPPGVKMRRGGLNLRPPIKGTVSSSISSIWSTRVSTFDEADRSPPGARDESSRDDQKKLAVGSRQSAVPPAESREPRADGPPVDWGRACQIANRLTRKLGRKCTLEADRSLVLKAAAASLERGEHWLWDAVEGTRLKLLANPKANPWAYLTRCLATSYGPGWHRRLATLDVPEDLLHPPPVSPAEDLSERLCVSAYDPP